mgnify:CR=1 FL=1
MAGHKFKGRSVVGIIEKVYFKDDGKEGILAKIDTGATKSSIDIKLAGKLKLGPVIRSKVVKSAHGSKLRPIVEAQITLEGKNMKTELSLADRSHMKYQVLIGQDILKHGFFVDPALKVYK